jgi:microcystin degradation protein MlrC
MKRIVLGSVQHETNTFSPVETGLEDFHIVSGEEMLDRIAATRVFSERGWRVTPTLYANALPSGKVTRDCFDQIMDRFLSSLPEHPDGVWLHLHGAMEVEEIGSGEVALLREVRRKIGAAVPMAVALDLHANNDRRIESLPNIICGYRTAPHTDIEATQIRAAEMLVQAMDEGLDLRPVVSRIPMLVSGDAAVTSMAPMAVIMERADELERSRGILNASVFIGQPWVDAPNTGASVVVTARNRGDAVAAATELAQRIWDAREQFHFPTEALSPQAAAEKALAASEDLVFVADSGDNPTAGAAGDNALLLRILLDRGAKQTLVAGIRDRGAVASLWKKGVGEGASIVVGAELDRRSERLELRCTLVRKASVVGWSGEDAGRAVVVKANGIDIIVTERRCAFSTVGVFRSVGVDFRRYKIVVVKLGYLFPELERAAKKSIMALTPGASQEAIDKLRFARVKRPVWPLDRELQWRRAE